MKLHYQLLVAESDALPVVLIHGLFGNLDNLGVLASELNQHCKALRSTCATTGYHRVLKR